MKKERITGALVKTVTPYDGEGRVDIETFARYIAFVKAEGAESILVPSVLGDSDLLTFEEKLSLVKCAVQTAGDTAMIIAEVSGEEVPAGKQAEEYLKAGADAVCLRYRFTTEEEYEALVDEVIKAGAEYVVLTDYGPGGFDMNTGARRAAGIPFDEIVKLYETREQVKSVIISVPLNETGSKCTRLCEKTDHKLNIIADTATDQIPEQIDRGAEAFTTGAFVKVFNAIYKQFTGEDKEAGRKLFFTFLRVIVWTKQGKPRESYLTQLYLQEKGMIPCVSFRREVKIDEYMERYGREMVTLAVETEKECRS